MSIHAGFRKAVGVAQEAAFDTYLAAATWLPIREGANIQKVHALLEGPHLHQQPYRYIDDSQIGMANWTAALSGTVPVKSQAWKTLLFALFGSHDETGASPPYIHTYVPALDFADFLGLSLTQWIGDNVNEIRASGGRVTQLTIGSTGAGLIEWSAQLFGATYLKAAKAGTPALTLDAPPYFDFAHATVTMEGAALILSGFDITFTNKIATAAAEAWSLGSSVPAYLDSTGFDVTGTLNRRLLADGTNQSVFNEHFDAHTPLDLVFTLNGGADMTLVITLQVYVGQPTVSGAGIITESIPFVAAYYDGAPITVVMTDDTTGS